jgi:hypothetical protein
MTDPSRRGFAVGAVGILLAAVALGLAARAQTPAVGSTEWCYEMLRATAELDERCPRLKLESGLEPADWRRVR